jgi:dTDP-glucose 4,6-dehydratase
VVLLDALTYAGSLANVADCLQDERCLFVHGNINNRELVASLLATHHTDAVMHLAAETHVDRSISTAEPFIETNVVGTLSVLEAIRAVRDVRGSIRLVHVSTDEVYGALTETQAPFDETDKLDPTSPYAASKAAADHLVSAFVKTHGLDALITRCCNNYGSHQFPEKFIPLMVVQALKGRPLPVYGDGRQKREWLHVHDHCTGLVAALQKGRTGEVYNFGSGHEEANIDVVRRIVQLTQASTNLIEHVPDRPAHDRRYAVSSVKARAELGWQPTMSFEDGLESTVAWYRDQVAFQSEQQG